MKNVGKLKIFLGYAAGVGKTYQMLEEAQQLRERGVDVVIGYFEPHGRKDTIAKTEGLELVPRKKVEYRVSVFEEMDADAIIARKPRIVVPGHMTVNGSIDASAVAYTRDYLVAFDEELARATDSAALIADGQLDASDNVLDQATKRFPVDPAAFAEYARLSERLNHFDGARRALIQYCALVGVTS